MAFANYHVSNGMAGTMQNLTSTLKTITTVAALSTTQARRGQVYDISFGANDAPNATDCAIQYTTLRTSTTGTSTGVTPSPIDGAGQISLGQGSVNYTAEPTTGVHLLAITLNQRASQRWVAAPGSELVYPATTLNGVSTLAKSSNYASTVTVSMLFTEL